MFEYVGSNILIYEFMIEYVGSNILIHEFKSWITGVCSPHVISLCDFAYYVVAVQLTLWYIMFICHQDYVCENSICSVYVGGYCGLSERGFYVFRKLCPVGFLVVGECPSVLL